MRVNTLQSDSTQSYSHRTAIPRCSRRLPRGMCIRNWAGICSVPNTRQINNCTLPLCHLHSHTYTHTHLCALSIIFILAGKRCLVKLLHHLTNTLGGVSQHGSQWNTWENKGDEKTGKGNILALKREQDSGAHNATKGFHSHAFFMNRKQWRNESWVSARRLHRFLRRMGVATKTDIMSLFRIQKWNQKIYENQSCQGKKSGFVWALTSVVLK